MTLYDILSINKNNSFDICDNVYDFCNCFDLPNSLDDNYNKFIDYIAKKIDVVEYDNDYITCKISEFIFNNLKPFNKFMNEQNNEDYKPRNYNLNYKSVNELDDTFYELYINTFMCLINGNYCEYDYEKIYKYLNRIVALYD